MRRLAPWAASTASRRWREARGECVDCHRKDDAHAGTLDVLADADEWLARDAALPTSDADHVGCGRELFALFRNNVASADLGAGIFGDVA